MDPVPRERLRYVLVQTYFSPEIQPQVASYGFINLAAFAYSARRYELIRLTNTVHLCPQNVRYPDTLVAVGGGFFEDTYLV